MRSDPSNAAVFDMFRGRLINNLCRVSQRSVKRARYEHRTATSPWQAVRAPGHPNYNVATLQRHQTVARGTAVASRR